MTDKASPIKLANQLVTNNNLALDMVLDQFELTHEEYRKEYPDTPVTPGLALDLLDARQTMTRAQMMVRWSLNQSQLHYALYNENALQPKLNQQDLARARVITALQESDGSKTQTAIAEELSVSQAYVHKIAKELGLLPANRKPRVVLTTEQRREVIDAVNQGAEVANLAKDYGVARDTIYKLMRSLD